MAQLSVEEWTAVALSLKVAFWATIAGTPFGLALALILARGRSWGLILLDAAVHLPLVMPPVVVGYLLLLAFGRRGPVGKILYDAFGITLAFRWTGAALACLVMGLPLMVRAMRLAIESVDHRLEQAAATLGSSPASVFFRITVPLAAPGILAGAVLCFARALGEFGATITFVSSIPGETQTIASAIYSYTQVPGGDAGAIRLTIVSVAISFAALILSEALARRLRARRPVP